MKHRIVVLGVISFFTSCCAYAQSAIKYQLRYNISGAVSVRLAIVLPEAAKAPVTLVMPRTIPGGYEQVPYDAFVENIMAFSPEGKTVAVNREPDGPRWDVGHVGETVGRIVYQVNVVRMEDKLPSAEETSKVRKGYLGLLGYSVFAYVDGLEDRKIELQITAPAGWPIVATLGPQVPAPTDSAKVNAPDYYALADSEVLMGPELKVRRIEGKIPLILAVYAEGEEDVDLEGKIAREALDRVQSYFGDVPFPQYTAQLEFLRPLPGHEYDFSQEHLDSGTFSLSVDRALTAQSSGKQREQNLFNYAHHMAHCWIPKRAYGVGYRPFTWEMAPVIDTIWFNEGFGRYAAIEAITEGLPSAEGIAFRENQLSRLRKVLEEAPRFIQEMPLVVLSREASFLLALDFRTGKNIFARGSLMAAEMDDQIRAKTEQKKSLRDALRAVLTWSAKNQRAFQVEELGDILSESTGVDVRDILERWSKAPRSTQYPNRLSN